MEFKPESLENSNIYLINLIKNSDNKPFLISRLGIGQETVTTYNYMACGRFSERNIYGLSNNNGIYCKSTDDVILFCKSYDDTLRNSNAIALWEPPLVNDILIPQNYFCKKYDKLCRLCVDVLEPPKIMVDTNIVPWTHSLKGKKVLVINPFVKSFKKQLDNNFVFFNKSKKNIFLDNQEFMFYKTYNTSAGNHIHKNWLETYMLMCKDISNIDFDIALLGCGGYGLPLCNFIKSKLNKSAIYIGGSLQLLFGVIGKRWEEDDIWKKIFDKEETNFIRPEESEQIKNKELVEEGCFW